LRFNTVLFPNFLASYLLKSKKLQKKLNLKYLIIRNLISILNTNSFFVRIFFNLFNDYKKWKRLKKHSILLNRLNYIVKQEIRTFVLTFVFKTLKILITIFDAYLIWLHRLLFIFVKYLVLALIHLLLKDFLVFL
jgi:hypothetical protein